MCLGLGFQMLIIINISTFRENTPSNELTVGLGLGLGLFLAASSSTSVPEVGFRAAAFRRELWWVKSLISLQFFVEGSSLNCRENSLVRVSLLGLDGVSLFRVRVGLVCLEG